MCKFLIERCGVDPEMRDRWGHRPLDEAERFGYPNVAAYLRARVALHAEKLEKEEKELETSQSREGDTDAARPARLVRITRELSQLSDSPHTSRDVSPPQTPMNLTAPQSPLSQLSPSKRCSSAERLNMSGAAASEEVPATQTATAQTVELKCELRAELTLHNEQPHSENVSCNCECEKDSSCANPMSATPPEKEEINV